jgi:glycogen debranching enzyme
MPFKVQVGPQQISIHQGQTVLVSEPDGQINWPSEKGLYFRDTRILSSWAIYANGEPWELLNGGATSYYSCRIFLTNRSLPSEDGTIPERTIGLTIGRSIAGGLHEDIDLANHGMKRVRFQLEIAPRCDFADVFEVKSGRIVRRGPKRSRSCALPTATPTSVVRWQFPWLARRRPRSTPMAGSASRLPSSPVRHGIAVFSTRSPTAMSLYLRRHTARSALKSPSTPRRWRIGWRRSSRSGPATRNFIGCFARRSRTWRIFLPAAGLPWFVAPFGRDSLIVSLQNMIIYPEFARGALEILGTLQAKSLDEHRDAEPGKILHEIRYGELAHFKLVPHTPYYGTADATPLYLITLHAAWRATGDRDLLEKHLDTAEGCLAWIDNHGDRDGDGFQEYQTRSSVGYENMGWKDAGDSVVYPDGSLVKGPKALCELQGYVYRAWIGMAEVFDALGKPDRAGKLRAKARELFDRFNEAFWDEELGFYAYALDGDKKKVLTIASNAGHCLTCGIVPRARATKVVARLMAPDMWTGWGIRTLSAKNPAFNPYGYQTGSVWPHDNAFIAMGFMFYGFRAEAARIAHDISVAASHFLFNQLPELYTTLERDDAFPIQYIGANVPQAWAAGSAFMLTQAILGFLPNAPRNKLYIDPWLPNWLPDIAVQDLRIGQHKLDIHFWRDGETTAFAVTKGDAGLVERCDISARFLAMGQA